MQTSDGVFIHWFIETSFCVIEILKTLSFIINTVELQFIWQKYNWARSDHVPPKLNFKPNPKVQNQPINSSTKTIYGSPGNGTTILGKLVRTLTEDQKNLGITRKSQEDFIQACFSYS